MSQEVYQPYINNPAEQVKAKRSIFDLSADFLGTLKSARLYPIFWQEMVPGDTAEVNMNTLIRMLTPVVPVMDSAILDIFLFKVPFRICMNAQNVDDKTFQRVMGENINGSGAVPTETSIPYFVKDDINTPELKNKIGNYLGIPYFNENNPAIGGLDPTIKISCVPFYAYQCIWNEFFRDEQTQNVYRLDAESLCKHDPFKVNKFHDLFTDATIRPQLHDPVSLSLSGTAPVSANNNYLSIGSVSVRGQTASGDSTRIYTSLGLTGGEDPTNKSIVVADRGNAATQTQLDRIYLLGDSIGTADLSQVSSVDINELRYSIALQSLYEAMNRGGSRYREYLYTVYDTVSDDKTLQLPQYLGGVSIPLEIDTVLQTSATGQNSALGDTGGFSATSLFGKHLSLVSTSEHCILMAVACVRTHQHYFQGIPKKFTHLKQTDFYNPLFEGIGDQPIMVSELVATMMNQAEYPSDKVFGYGPSWYEYRSGNQDSVLTGGFDPLQGDLILSKWTYAEPFSALPTLNANFKYQTETAIGKTLVDENTSSQFLLNVHFDIKCARNMRTSTVPAKLLGTF